MISMGTLWSKFFLRLHGKAIRNSSIDKTARIHYGSNIVSSSVGRYSYCGYDCWIIHADVGAFTSIAANVRIGGAAHPMEWVSTSPVFHEGRNILRRNFSSHVFETTKRTSIGNDVWIGENALIKAGVTVGNGAVIGMGSVVTKDVGAYEIWAGNPARLIRKRFDEATLERIHEAAWWDWSEQTLFKKASGFYDPELFLLEMEKEESRA